MFYVKMIDTFLSGWGGAENKVANYVIECETAQEAEIVAENAKNRTDMKKVSIVVSKPTYNLKKHQVSFVNKETAGNWFKEGFFKK